MRAAIKEADSPAPLGAYSRAVVANGFVFVSGQLGLLPNVRRLPFRCDGG